MIQKVLFQNTLWTMLIFALPSKFDSLDDEIIVVKRDEWSMTRYFSLILTAAVMMITAASPHSIELTHIHLAYISRCCSFSLHRNHEKVSQSLGWPSPSSDGCIGRDDPTSLRLHVESLLHCRRASASHFAPDDRDVSFLWTLSIIT